MNWCVVCTPKGRRKPLHCRCCQTKYSQQVWKDILFGVQTFQKNVQATSPRSFLHRDLRSLLRRRSFLYYVIRGNCNARMFQQQELQLRNNDLSISGCLHRRKHARCMNGPISCSQYPVDPEEHNINNDSNITVLIKIQFTARRGNISQNATERSSTVKYVSPCNTKQSQWWN